MNMSLNNVLSSLIIGVLGREAQPNVALHVTLAFEVFDKGNPVQGIIEVAAIRAEGYFVTWISPGGADWEFDEQSQSVVLRNSWEFVSNHDLCAVELLCGACWDYIKERGGRGGRGLQDVRVSINGFSRHEAQFEGQTLRIGKRL